MLLSLLLIWEMMKSTAAEVVAWRLGVSDMEPGRGMELEWKGRSR